MSILATCKYPVVGLMTCCAAADGMRRYARYEAMSKSKKYVPECYTSSYEKTVYWCSQNFRQFLCSSSANLVKGHKYDLCVSHLSGAVKAKVVAQGKSESLNEVDCGFTTVEVRRLEFSSPY